MIDAEFFGIVAFEFPLPEREQRRSRLLPRPWPLPQAAERVALILVGCLLAIAFRWNALAVPVILLLVANVYLWRHVRARRREETRAIPV